MEGSVFSFLKAEWKAEPLVFFFFLNVSWSLVFLIVFYSHDMMNFTIYLMYFV